MNVTKKIEKTENDYRKYRPYTRFWNSSAIMDFAKHNLPGGQVGL